MSIIKKMANSTAPLRRRPADVKDYIIKKKDDKFALYVVIPDRFNTLIGTYPTRREAQKAIAEIIKATKI